MDKYLDDPCPWRIFDIVGGSFLTGVLGGALLNSIYGYRRSPSGFRRKIVGSLAIMKHRTLKTGKSFAGFGLSYGTINCTLESLRRKNDTWNSLISGTLAGALPAVRCGFYPTIEATIWGATVFVLIVITSHMFTRIEVERMPQEPNQCEDETIDHKDY